jgi:hypothetical protein
MSPLPEGVHELFCDEFPCAWACGAVGDALGKAEEEALLLMIEIPRRHAFRSRGR